VTPMGLPGVVGSIVGSNWVLHGAASDAGRVRTLEVTRDVVDMRSRCVDQSRLAFAAVRRVTRLLN
jgi:hypothetical protein